MGLFSREKSLHMGPLLVLGIRTYFASIPCEKKLESLQMGMVISGMPVFRQKPEFRPWQFIFRPYVSVFCVQIEQF